jgi:hypothetical protein
MAETDPPARPGGRSVRRQRPPKRPGGDKPVSGYDEKQTLVRLTGGEADPDQVREALRGFFGEQVDAELGEHVAKLQQYEERIFGLLSEQPEELEAFVEDPLGVLGRRFPELELPPGRKPYIPTHVGVELEPAAQTDPAVMEIFQKLWEHLEAAEANTKAFEASPFSVIASVGASYPPDKVDKVVQAFEAVFGIHRLATTTGVLNLAFDHVRRP